MSAIRVGLIYDGAVIDERTVESPRPVTVGTELGATLSVDAPALPRQIGLVDWHDGRYVLRAFSEMEGRLRIDGAIESLEEARFDRDIDDDGASLIPLDDVSAGRIAFGDAVVLFQQTAPTSREPRPPSLPDELTWSPGSDLDGRLAGALAAAALLQIGVVAWAQIHDWPQPAEPVLDPGSHGFVNPDEMADWTRDQSEPEPKETPPSETPRKKRATNKEASNDGESTTSDESPEANDESTETDKKHAEASDASSSSNQRNVADSSVEKGTVLEALGSEGGDELLDDMETASASDAFDNAVANTRGDGPGPDRKQLETGGNDSKQTGETLDSDEEIGPVPGSRDAEKGFATGGPNEVTVDCPDCGGGSDGGPDASEPVPGVGEVIERHSGRIRQCYERALEKDDGLAGKLVVSLRVDRTGSPTAVRASRDTVGGGVAPCVLGIFRQMSFPAPDAKSSKVEKTFVFEPAR